MLVSPGLSPSLVTERGTAVIEVLPPECGSGLPSPCSAAEGFHHAASRVDESQYCAGRLAWGANYQSRQHGPVNQISQEGSGRGIRGLPVAKETLLLLQLLELLFVVAIGDQLIDVLLGPLQWNVAENSPHCRCRKEKKDCRLLEWYRDAKRPFEEFLAGRTREIIIGHTGC